jgi:hypothetical protein
MAFSSAQFGIRQLCQNPAFGTRFGPDMATDWNLIELTDLGVLRFRGVEAVKFLQGQVSNDVEKLNPEQSQLAGYHNPQGRAIALLRLVQLAPDDVLALLPRELASPVATRLTKFVLRTKVKITDESAGWKVTGLVAPRPGGASSVNASTAAQIESHANNWAAAQFAQATAAAGAIGERSSAAAQLEEADSVVDLPNASALILPDALNSVSRSETTAIIRVGTAPARWLVISPATEALPLTGCAVDTREAWRLLDIVAGVAQVYAATSEEFVAQMLNLDALGGISFEKGCYTGQEVIARAHYRGRVKRRMQRFLSREPLAVLAPGASGQLADGRTFKVVEAAGLANGRCEFLAVAPLVTGTDGESSTTSASVVDAEALPMSYPLPD